MKYYSIDRIHGSLRATDTIIQAENSKKALEQITDKPVVRNADSLIFSVVECDEQGRLHYDRRKWNYYGYKFKEIKDE